MRITGFAGGVLVILLCIQTSFSHAQSLDIGIDAGMTGFLGDLGGANFIGRPLFFDLETSLLKPAGSLHFRYYPGRRFAFKGSFTYTGVAGDDALIQPHTEFSPEWYRWYRNLNFQSDIIEGALTCEFNFKRFEAGSKRYRIAPYIFAGIGVFHFNPKAMYNGSLVELQPLHTEGQGFDSIDIKPYSLIQPIIPVGVGLRYNLSENVILGFEYRNNFTFTDYIDDVSTEYVSQAQFNNYFSDPAMAALAYDLSVRSDELDPEGINEVITGPGQQRGDSDKDQYIMMQVSVSYIIFNNSISSGFGKRNLIYPHRVRQGSGMFKHNGTKQYYKNKSRK